MKLLQESHLPELEVLVEQTAGGKVLYIEGPFIMTEKVNRNNRLYGKKLVEGAVDLYTAQYISERRAVGEFPHPEYPLPDAKKAAILTESLSWQGNNVIGKARVLDTPDGLIIKALLEANFKLGVSTRGLGDVRNNGKYDEVTRWILNAIDAVDMPSGQDCYVNPINESLNWVEKNGLWVAEQQKQGANVDRLIEEMAHLFSSFAKNKPTK